MPRLTRKVLLTVVFIFTSLLFASHSLLWGNALEGEGQRIVFGRPRPSDNNIFFFDGSCAQNQMNPNPNEYSDPNLRLDVKQACAIESAARANPDMNIYLFTTCYFDENSITKSNQMAQEILSKHKNIYIWHQSLESLYKNSPMENFFYSKKMFDTPFKKIQSSNIGRILLLKKFGGVYLDLDFIVQRSLSGLAVNFAGMESRKDVNGAVLRFGIDAAGRRAADMFVEEMTKTFNGKIWGHNGPRLTTSVVKKLCKLKKVVPRSAKQCSGFTVYREIFFYPVPYWHWKHFYEEKWTDKILKMTENSIAVHLWNSMVRFQKIPKFPDLFRDSNQPLTVLQRKYCPIAHSFNNITKIH